MRCQQNNRDDVKVFYHGKMNRLKANLRIWEEVVSMLNSNLFMMNYSVAKPIFVLLSSNLKRL